MSKIKLSENELQELKKLQDEGNKLIFSLGQIEAQKTSIFTQIQEIQEGRNKIGKELQDKYGDGDIDLETGEFTKIN
jgi:flagellar biosynthesis chaperone FliJ|tara:strand:- start:1780 stop:2010 length:231 start_codon:yes stop_codon:yes gene_type:complete